MGKRLIIILSLGVFVFLVLVGWAFLGFFMTSARPCGGPRHPPCPKFPVYEPIVNCLKRKAENGDKRSAWVLSEYLGRHGYYNENETWRQKAAEMGYSFAQARIAQFNRFKGSGDEEKIIAELIKLGEGGEYVAAFELSEYYGRWFFGFPRDSQKASFWQKRAAELLPKNSDEEELQRQTLWDCQKETVP